MNRRTFLTTVSVFGLLAPVAIADTGPGLGLIFVGAGSCPYCPIIAPVLAQLSDAADIPVLLASMDGQGIYPFMDFKDGRTHPLTMGFTDIPHVLIWNARRNEVTHKVSGFRNPRHFFQLLGAALGQARQL